jgi:branched-chain amino acid transport system ATP-binding protein
VPETLLRVDGLEVRYGPVRAVFDVSFELAAGEVLAVLGPNGAGKSSLAHALSGLLKPTAGSIVLDGMNVVGVPAHALRRRGVSYVPEGRGILRGLTVEENLRVAVRIARNKQGKKDALERVFTMFPALRDRRAQRASTLSGGEQQMLALGRALAVDPQILIADEISLGLSPRLVDVVFEALYQAKTAGLSIIVIEQFAERALALADRCFVIRQGRVAWHGPAKDAESLLGDAYLGVITAENTT